MPLAFLNDEQAKVLEEADAAVLYARMETRLPFGINGYPIFPEMGTLSKEEWKIVCEYHKKLHEAQQIALSDEP
jgi:hypothetical protein